jgi:nitrogen fixation NifU-like protein
VAEELPLEDHFRNPRNAGVLADADFKIRAENPVCGDVLDLYVRRDAEGRVAACRFQVYGCPAAIAAGSVLTELVEGASLEELRAIDAQRVSRALGSLPEENYHACVLAADAVALALRRW